MKETSLHPKPKVILCSAAWKECLSPTEANMIIAEALQARFPAWEIQTFPLSDGGDGWLEAMASSNPDAFVSQTIEVMGPTPEQRVQAHYLWSPKQKQVLIEAAEIHGMRRLPQGKRAPLTATSYGVGEAFRALHQRHPDVQEIILSVGGSASTDGGIGFLQALGWQFVDHHGSLISEPIGGGMLTQIARFEPVTPDGRFPQITLLTDVTTRYIDSPRLFGPQKGASPDQVTQLTHAFQRLIALLDPQTQYAQREGSGAAGGLPFGVSLRYPRVTIQSGVQWTADATGLNRALSHADLVITGEGRFDETSLLGKGTGYLLERTEKSGIPLVICCGQSTFSAPPRENVIVLPLYPLDYRTSTQDLRSAPGKLKQVLTENLSAIEQRLA